MTCECGRTALIRIGAHRSPHSLMAKRHKVITKHDHPLCRICWRALFFTLAITIRTRAREKMTDQDALHYLAPRCIKGRPQVGTAIDSTRPIRYVGYVDEHGTIHPCGNGTSYATAINEAPCTDRCPSRR